MELNLDKCRDLFEVIETRESRKSIIIVSQLPVASWYQLFANTTYADACLARIVHIAFRAVCPEFHAILPDYTFVWILS